MSEISREEVIKNTSHIIRELKNDEFEYCTEVDNQTLNRAISDMKKSEKIEKIIERNHICKDCEIDSIHCKDDCLIKDLQDIRDVVNS